MKVMIPGNEYGERVKAVELQGEHFEAVSQVHYDNGLKASVVYSKNGEVMGAVRMDHDAAEAMIIGMKALPHVWKVESESGNQWGYQSDFYNMITGVKVGVYR